MPVFATQWMALVLVAALGVGVAGAGVNVWTPVGPEGTAWLQAFAVDPTSPDTLYAGFPGDRGLWKSHNGGKHWFESNTGIPRSDRWIIGIAVHPADSNVIYAASAYRKVFKSTDAGRTWQASSDGMPPSSGALGSAWFVFDPGNPATMYVSWTGAGGSLFKSSDAGATWERRDPVPGVGVSSLAGSGTTPQVLYAALGFRGIYRSTDGATTWTLACTGLPVDSQPDFDRYNTWTIAMDPTNPLVLYTVSNRVGKVYRTTDGAGSWAAASSEAFHFSRLGVQPGSGHVFAIGVDYLGSSPTHLSGLYRSTDGGGSWASVTPGHRRAGWGGFHPADPSVMYALIDQGIAKTTDGGTTWAPAFAGLRVYDAPDVAFSPASPATVWAGFWTVGMGKSTDGGATFSMLRPLDGGGPYGERFALHPSDPDTVITDSWNPCFSNPLGTPCPESSLIVSNDGGSTWRRIPNPIYPQPRGMMQVWGLAVDPSNPSTVLAAGVAEDPGIYRSIDGGNTFAAVGGTGAPLWPSALVAAATTPTSFYLGTSSHATHGSIPGIWRSRDAGSSWQRIITGLPTDTNVRDIAIHPATPTTLFIAVSGVDDSGVYTSTDGGESWRRLPGVGLPDPAAVLSVEVDPSDPNVMYAGAGRDVDPGIYRSSDGGATWNSISDGLDSRTVWHLAIDPRTPGRLLAGTRSGVYEITLDASDSDGDGVTDFVENGAPFAGDGNRDGVPDRLQPHVGSLPSTAGYFVTIAAPEGARLKGVAAVANPSPASVPPGISFPFGFFRFSVVGLASGGSTTATMFLPVSRSISTHYGFGPTPQMPAPHWYRFAFDAVSGAEVFQDADQTRVVLNLVDGERGDGDLYPNGVVVSTGGPAVAPIPAAERAALIALYFATGGSGWTNQNGWKTPPTAADGFAIPGTECTWYGVACGPAGGVASLLLPANNLDGTIPATVGSLSGLTSVDLAGNRLRGAMPAEFGVLARLESLNLSSNVLTGSIPAALGQAASLKVLHLGDNVLGGSLPVELGNLVKLEHLHLHDNPLAGALPGSLARLSALQHLSYQNTRLCAPGDAGFQSWLAGIPDRQDSGLICGTYAYLIPSVAHLPGSAGTQWRTDVAVVNWGASAVLLQATYHSSGAPLTRTTSLAVNAALEWRDVLVSLFGVAAGASTSGTIAISASGPVVVTSRTYNETATGTFGQYFPALTAAAGMLGGTRGYLPQLRKSAGFRTNVGFLNLGTAPATVVTRVIAAGGEEVGRRTTTIQPQRWFQENDIFAVSGAGARDLAYATVDIQPPGGRVWAYASLVDNATGDPTTIPLLCGTPPGPLRVPSVAHIQGTGRTQWRTDLAAVNPGTSPVEMTMTLAFAGSPITKTVVLDAGTSAEWRDAVVSLFGRDASAATSGTVEIVATAPVHVTSRTYNETPTGTYGQFYPACTMKDALRAGQVGILPQLGKSARVRTNIGILNLGDATCAVRVRLFDQAGLQRGDPRVITAAAGRWKQENDIFALAGAGEVDIAYATVETDTPGGAAWAYASVVDAATGDPTTVPVLVPY